VRTERSSTGRADRFGVFRLCGVPSDVSLLVRAVTQEGAIAVDEVNLAGRPVGVRSLRLPTAALGAAPGGALTGRVRRPGGDPAGGATITVPALGLEVVADARGDFSIAGLPSGVHGVEARLVGFRGTRVRVPMGASRGAHVSLTLGGAVNVLPATTVRERRGPSALEGFERRRREGGGHFVGADEIRARAPATLLDVLTGLPGLQVTTNERTGAGALPSIVVTRALGQFGAMAERCPPAIFLDGVRIAEVMASGTQIPLNHLPSPGEVHGIEVYSNLASAPAQFQVLGSGCGVIAVWTKRGAPR
jgi:hypothetical protein